MARALGEPGRRYARLQHRGIRGLERELFNGEYFFQRTEMAAVAGHLPAREVRTIGVTGWGLRNARRSEAGRARRADGSIRRRMPGDRPDGTWLSWACGLDTGWIEPRSKVTSWPFTAIISRKTWSKSPLSCAGIRRRVKQGYELYLAQG